MKVQVKLQNPGDLFETSRKFQKQLLGLQGDINDAIEQVVIGVSSILKSSTQETLEQYELLYDEVDDIYAPLLTDFNALAPSECRDLAASILNDTTTFTGFNGGICARTYDIGVGSCIDNANQALSRIDGLYSQVQMIVVKAFIGQNSLTTPEDIEQKIEEIFKLVNSRWESSKPELESLRSRLAAEIAAHNVKLGECNTFISEDVASLSGRFSRMVQTCVTFDSPLKSKSVDILSANSLPSYKQQFEEFQAELSILKAKKMYA